MYAHVTTYRLGTEEETHADMAAETPDAAINDQAARTIASWWHSPAPTCRNITALSHGLPFDTEELRDEISREITDHADQTALLEWLDVLEAILSD